MRARLPHTRRGQIWSIVILIGIAGLSFLWWLNGNPEALFTPDGESYGSSLARELDQPGAKCTDQPDRPWWVCDVETDPGSGYSGVYYVLYERDSRCWKGTRYRPEVVQRKPLAISIVPRGPEISGCLNLRDFLFPKTVESPAPSPLRLAAPEEPQVRTAVKSEFEALAKGRWALACQLRSSQDRHALAAIGGTCEKALARVFAGAGDSLADVEVVNIRLTGQRARFEVRAGGNGAATDGGVPNAGVAVKEHGRWRIQQPQA
jgi:hypothetical protein